MLWIYWDPPIKAFTIPFINHPVSWYGICFAFGFFLSYFFLHYQLKWRIDSQTLLQISDISNWKNLIAALLRKDQASRNIFAKMNPATRELLYDQGTSLLIKDKEKEDIVQAINIQMNAPDSPFANRRLAETFFPEAITKSAPISRSLLDSFAWYVVLGTLIGARLAHVFFYEWPYYQHHLFAIVKIWEGGLASHGGAIGIFLGALLYYYRHLRPAFPSISFLNFFDIVAVPVPLAGAFIRFGNFINQEIVGIPSSAPWAVLFAHPLGGDEAVPRHPVQLYEALAYMVIFFLLLGLWYFRRAELKPGFLAGLMLACIFTSRFFIEFLKTSQSIVFDESFLQTGQYLSIPFIIWGVFLMWRSSKISDTELTPSCRRRRSCLSCFFH